MAEIMGDYEGTRPTRIELPNEAEPLPTTMAFQRPDYPVTRRHRIAASALLAGAFAIPGYDRLYGRGWSGPQVSPEQYAASLESERTYWQLFGRQKPARPRPKNCCRAKRRGRTQCR